MFRGIKAYKSDFVFLRKILKTLIKDLKISLNKVHKISLTSRQWTLILKGWLDYYLIIVFYYWRIEKENKKKLLRDTIFFDSFEKNHIYYLYSNHFKKNILKDIVLFKKKKLLDNQIKSNNNNFNSLIRQYKFYNTDSIVVFFFKKFLYKITRLILKVMPKVSINYLLFETCYSINFLSKIYGKKYYLIIFYFYFINKLNYLLVLFGKKDFEKRFLFAEELEKKTIKIKNKSFKKYLYYRISKDFPVYALESFKIFFFKTVDVFKVNKVITSYLLNSLNNYAKFWLVKSIKKTKLFYIEHGGTFRKELLGKKMKEDITDKEITWFQAKKKKQKQIYFNPLLYKYSRNIKSDLNPESNNLGIILKHCTISNSFVTKGSSSEDSFEILENLKKLKTLLRSDISKNFLIKNPIHLNEKNNPHIIYKKYFGLNSFFSTKKTNLYEINKDFYNKCRLIITVYPETTFSELTIVNKPFFCYFKYSYSNFLKEDLNIIKAFEKAKILFNNPLKLSKHINSVWDNPSNWFYSESNQEILNLFRKRYLGAKSNYTILRKDKFKKFFNII